eukprot:3750969-Amphidinium_carterae.2
MFMTCPAGRQTDAEVKGKDYLLDASKSESVTIVNANANYDAQMIATWSCDDFVQHAKAIASITT